MASFLTHILKKQNPNPQKLSLKAKLLISIVSLCFFLFLAEIALRITGNILLERKQQRSLWQKNVKGTKILCTGDSFTNGGMVPRNATYPALLQAKLTQTGYQCAVFNGGICEVNSMEILNRLKHWVPKYEPDIVILLVGSANRFNPWDYNLHQKKNITSYIKSKFYNLKLVKLFWVMSINLRADNIASDHDKKGAPSDIENALAGYQLPRQRMVGFMDYLDKKRKIVQPNQDNFIDMLWYYSNTRKADTVIKKGIDMLSTSSKNDRLELIAVIIDAFFQKKKYSKASDLLQDIEVKYSKTAELVDYLSTFYMELAHRYRLDLKFGQAIPYFLKAIEYDPRPFNHLYMMSKIYDMQSRVSAQQIATELQRIGDSCKDFGKKKLVSEYEILYRDKQGYETGLQQWISDDLSEIAELCRGNDVTLVLQNYPISYPIANQALKKTAVKYNLPFVDNTTVFSTLVDDEVYFLDDDHCTKKGHEIMVQNLYPEIVKIISH